MSAEGDVPPSSHETAAPAMRPWGIVPTTLFGFLILLATDISQGWVLGPQLRPLDQRLRQMEAEDPAVSPDALREIAHAYFEANNVDLVFYVSILVMALVMVLLTLVFVRLKGRHLLRPYLALYPVSLRAALVGIGIVLAYQLAMFVANHHFAVEVRSEAYREEVIPALLLEAINAAPLWMLMLMYGLGMPVAEEVLFRGFLLRGYLGINPSALRIALAVLWTSAAFAVLQHVHVAPIRMAELGGLGLMLGLVRVWSGSLFLPIAMHIAHNVAVVPLGLWFWA